MSRRHRAIFGLAVLVLVLLFLFAGCKARDAEGAMDRAELEQKVQHIMKQPNVSQRRDIRYIYRLADLYYEEGNTKKALDLYLHALTLDSLNFPVQLRAARLLLDTGDAEQARLKAEAVYRQAEDTDQIREAEGLLTEMGQPPAPFAVNEAVEYSPVEIVLVPMGDVNPYLLEELKRELEPRTGLRISIANTALATGEIDRPYVARNSMRTFIETVFDLLNIPYRKKGQYDVERLIAKLKLAYPLESGSRIKGYLGVTGADIYAKNYNFVFGWTPKGHGIMSYARFTAAFNHEPPDRPRLLDRTLKQALSSTSLLLGIPRCSTPDCARAYPNSLAEHDAKSSELCDICKGRLKAYLSRQYEIPPPSPGTTSVTD